MSKNYIKIDKNNNIIKVFSDDFEKPDQDSINIKTYNRHFNLELLQFVTTDLFVYKYKYVNNKIKQKTKNEIKNEINTILNSDEIKLQLLKTIRLNLFDASNWINGFWTAQEFGHKKGVNLKDRILSESLYTEWVQWFETMGYITTEINLSEINYNDIKIDNTNIFPKMPNFPGDILNTILQRR